MTTNTMIWTRINTILLIALCLFQLNSIAQTTDTLDGEAWQLEILAMRSSYIVPLPLIEKQINDQIEKTFTGIDLSSCATPMTGMFIAVRKNGKIKRIAWEEQLAKEDSLGQKHRQVVEAYIRELKYFNNAYMSSNGEPLKLKEIFFIYRINKSGKIAIKL